MVNLARTFSLDKEVKTSSKDQEEASLPLRELIPAESSPETVTDSTEVEKIFSTLTPKEKWVVANFFGLQDYLDPCDSKRCKESQELEAIRQLYMTTILRHRKKTREDIVKREDGKSFP